MIECGRGIKMERGGVVEGRQLLGIGPQGRELKVRGSLDVGLGFGVKHLLVTSAECEQGGDLRTEGGHRAESEVVTELN